MRLAVEVTTCTTARTGIGYYTEHLVDGLLATCAPDDEVVLLSNRPPAPELGRRWHQHLVVAGSATRALWMQKDVPGLLDKAGIDVAAFPNYVVPLASPCPTIVFVHDLALVQMPELFPLRKRIFMRTLLRQSIVSASRIATVSDASRGLIAAWTGLDAQRIALLPGAPHLSCGAVPDDEVAAVRARHGLGRPYVLTVGTLEPRKNLPTLLAAFDDLRRAGDQGLDLVVVGGRGWHDRNLLRALEARAPQGRVHWLGYVAESELVALYAGAQLFVYPSRSEGFGLPVVEAMACGTPVVASDVPAIREVAGDAALLVPPGDAAALAAAMVHLLSHPEAADAARLRGRARAARFSWTRTAEAMWQLAHATGSARLPGRSARPTGAARPPQPAPAPSSSTVTSPPGPLGAPPTGLDPREWAVLATVAYADLFDAPLSVTDALSSCIGLALTEVELHRLLKRPALAALVTLHPAGHSAVSSLDHPPAGAPAGDGVLVLAGRDELVARRQDGRAKTAALLERHRRTLTALATLPFVRMLAFSGGTAHQNPGAHPDIDLFVIAAAGHLYTVYTLMFLATKVTGTRTIVCPNYLIDDAHLGIAYHHDVFTANQLIAARPIAAGPGGQTYTAFWETNQDWVQRFFPGATPRASSANVGVPLLQHVAERVLGPLAAPVERGLRWSWRLRLRRRAAGAPKSDVALGDGILKLHLSDYRRRVLLRFDQRLATLRDQLQDRAGAAAIAASAAARPVRR